MEKGMDWEKNITMMEISNLKDNIKMEIDGKVVDIIEIMR